MSQYHKDSDEFADAVPIEKVHRYRIVTEPAPTVFFGLLGTDGELRRFQIDPIRLPAVSSELRELWNFYRHYTKGGQEHQFLPRHMPSHVPMWKDGGVLPYVGSRMKLMRAESHTSELEGMLLEYSHRLKLTSEKANPSVDDTAWKVHFSEPPPASIPLVLGDVVHNLRAALDILVGDLARLSGSKVDQLKFPFAKSKTALEKILQEEHQHVIGDVASDAILNLKPYIGGNVALRGLHDLDIIDKHRLIVPTFSVAWHEYSRIGEMVERMNKQHPDRPPMFVIETNSLNILPIKDGDILLSTTGDDPLKHYTAHEKGVEARFAALSEGLPFAGEPVLATLGKLSHLVGQIVADFAASFPVKP